VTADREQWGRLRFGVDVLGDDDVLKGIDPGGVLLANGIGSVGDTGLRTTLFERYRAMGFAFPRLVHPSAVVSVTAQLGAGCQLLAGCVVQPGAVIGDGVLINTRSSVDHDCDIGEHAHVAPGAVLCGEVRVGEGAHVGAGAVVIQGITIGARALVAAGAVVISDVPADSKVMGVPAQLVRP
jgi:UDP-perosamine 4-acetyltransferase